MKLHTRLLRHANTNSSWILELERYLTSRDLQSARKLFDRIPNSDLRSWTLVISAHTRHGFHQKAIQLYATLRAAAVDSLSPDKFLILSAAKACAASGNLCKAVEVHDDAVRFGYVDDTLLGNVLIDMFAKCKSVDRARLVFDGIVDKDVISWNSMASCYVNCRLPGHGLVTFREMGLSGIVPNPMTLSSILPACSELKDSRSGREIHGFVVRNGMEINMFVSSALVNMYANCLRIKQAQLVFDNMVQRDTVSWNVLIAAYFQSKEYEKGLDLFRRMRNQGIRLHQDSWNSVICGCVQNQQSKMALKILVEMQNHGFKPNPITVASVLPACTDLENLRGGKEIHSYIYRHGLSIDLSATTCLLFMYAKCGDLEHSQRVFNLMVKKDVVLWNTAIIANSMHGKGKEALALFRKMLDSGIKPNPVTFTAVLTGCSHSRFVEEGFLIFDSMKRDHSVEPNTDHYSCMVDVLSRAGRLEEAYEFIQKIPFKPNASAWGALLAACRVYKNVELARVAANRLFEIEPENPGPYRLFFNILVAAKLWEEASEIRKLMRDRGVAKTPGRSWVYVKGKVYTFVPGDRNNQQIYRFLDEIFKKMKSAGYVPNTDFVLQNVNQEEKEEILCNHSEKLAVAFGILNLNGEASIRVFKNLRICVDCHNAIKFMAKIVGLTIIVRDSLRFHHFKDGRCSCNDFW